MDVLFIPFRHRKRHLSILLFSPYPLSLPVILNYFMMHILHLADLVGELMSSFLCVLFVFQTASPALVTSSGRKHYCMLLSEFESGRPLSSRFILSKWVLDSAGDA
jgi:hypothetical protein